MATQRKKLQGNGMWESSRMMLPEHVNDIRAHAHERNRRKRIALDEQEWEDISRVIGESLQQRSLVTVRLYHPFEELTVEGIVDRVDQMRRRFMVDGEWFEIRDVEGASVGD
ncbi:YolD-like family protein [Paenibacillus sp. MCAF20]